MDPVDNHNNLHDHEVEEGEQPVGMWRIHLEKPISVHLSPAAQIDLMYQYAVLSECNDAMAKMYGLATASDLIGKRLGEMLPSNRHNLEYLSAFIANHYELKDAQSQETDHEGRLILITNNLQGVVENGYLTEAIGYQWLSRP